MNQEKGMLRVTATLVTRPHWKGCLAALNYSLYLQKRGVDILQGSAFGAHHARIE